MLILIKNHKLLSAAVVVGLVAVCAIGINAYNNRDTGKPRVSPTPKAAVNDVKSQPAANNGEKDVNANGSKVNQGTSNDSKGTAKASTTSSQWTISESGVITVKEPTNNGTIVSGANLIGTATVDRIQYRLIDDNAGVVSQGFIGVTDGKFSASISFPSYAKTGRLDVFNTNDQGAEINEVQIKVNFGA